MSSSKPMQNVHPKEFLNDSSSDASSSSPYAQSSSMSTTSDNVSSTAFSSTSYTSRLSKEEQEELAARETQAVRRSRALFISILAIFAATGAAITFHFATMEETNDFESEFKDFAHEINDVSHHNAHNSHGVAESFRFAVTSLSSFTQADWPNFMLPHFSERADRFMKTTGADFLALSPVVGLENKEMWEAYTIEQKQPFLSELNGAENVTIPNKIHSFTSLTSDKPSEDGKNFVPIWQTSPLTVHDVNFVNFDLLSHATFRRIYHYILETKEPVLSEVLDVTSLFGPNVPNSSGHPQSLLVEPILRDFTDDSNDTDVVALLIAVLPWDIYFSNLLHEGAENILAVLEDSCGDEFTYRIDGPEAHYVGEGDLHNEKYDHLLEISDFEPFEWHEEEEDNSNSVNCHYIFRLYPTPELEDQYKTNKPIFLTCAVLAVFVITSALFAAYDLMVQRRQTKVMEAANKSNAIVSSLFPKEIRDRLFAGARGKRKKTKRSKKHGGLLPTLTEAPKFRLNNFLNEDDKRGNHHHGNLHRGDDDDEIAPVDLEGANKPIADLFPQTTVMFGDIAGFTAWSSVRQPSEVFTLLETLYRAFDKIAKRRHVFKVETIGDCYVAVAGLPEPRADHAVVMARFARDCLNRMADLTNKLEVTLGPDTGDLQMRFGLHSGPVTAGVLRGDKSRFQLFGDTVNTAARMESTGERNRIQISEETATLLREAEKESWFEPREEAVHAKGKGELHTFWLHPKDKSKNHQNGSVMPGEASRRDSVNKANAISAKTERMVGWSVDVLARLLKKVIAKRNADQEHQKDCNHHNDKRSYSLGGGSGKHQAADNRDKNGTSQQEIVANLETMIGRSMTVQEEVTEFVALPKFNKESAARVEDPKTIELNPQVIEQLHDFVASISTMYRHNAFHNFEHASHVTMSVSKLLARIVAADVAPGENQHPKGQSHILENMHNRTYGITSDPLTQFAVVFSALIHDVDHRGVPNFLLIQQEPELSNVYNGRSVAEQNSVDLAWEHLMEPRFDDLRACIYTNETELRRFRQTVVNTVMATDIFDKEFADLRKRRWDRCFHSNEESMSFLMQPDDDHSPDGIENTMTDNINRRATIVVEHLIQASDVAHTMQHWQIYQKWNARLFEEMYAAFQEGRNPKDPSETWFESELGFFDNYIIPLARKLKECGVFGVSSDEYLNYALENRMEWSNRGKAIVAKSLAKLKPAQPKTRRGSMH